MPVNTHDLFQLAQRLQQGATTEADLRAAISRAYYAGLHAVAETFDARERMGDESSHAEIIGRAKAHGNTLEPGRQAANQIAQHLSKMRRTRNDADYKLDLSFNESDSQGIIDRAALVLSLCQDVISKRTPTLRRVR